MAVKFVIVGGGPGGNQAATYAARMGAEVTLVERDIVGGAAHLWDCIPSKAMIATGGAMGFSRRAHEMGLEELSPQLDVDALKGRIADIESHLNRSITELLESQGVRLLRGTGRLKGPYQVVVETDFPEFVDQDGGVGQRRIGQQALQQRGLARAEEARDQIDGGEFNHCRPRGG